MIKQKATEINIKNPDFNMIHGHAKIILTDAKTGKQRVSEHDNVFQSTVIAKYLHSLGEFNNNPWYNSTWAEQDVWRNLCGGILLFNDTIDTSNGAVEYMPAGVGMVANGAYGVVNNGTPVELGSYNLVESSTSGNSSISFVYDWGTSQGNGTIKCVCLTSETGGYIGYGNPSGEAATRRDFKTNQTSRAALNAYSIPYKNMRYTFSINTSTSKLTVTKYRFAVTEASIFNGKQISATDYTYSQTLTSATKYLFKYIGGGKVAIMPSLTNIANNATVYFLIFNLENNTFSQGTIINTSGNVLETGFSDTQVLFGMVGDYVALPTKSESTTTVKEPICVFDASNGALVASFGTSQDWGSGNPAAVPLTDELMYLGNRSIFDPENETAYPCNGYFDTQSGTYTGYNDNLDAFTGASASYPCGAWKNPLYLATINNLDTAIVKDNTQTMKVIYTLTAAT